MKVEFDARGLVCPMPVVEAKKSFDAGADSLEIIVDNKIAVENLEKFAKSKELNFSYKEKSPTEYIVFISGDYLQVEKSNEQENFSNLVVVISSKIMGEGDEVLGANLLKAFIYSLSQLDDLPKSILFYNSGAFITTENSPSLDDLKKLENEGVEILTCGACLNHYNLVDKLKVGSVTNMYEIVKKQVEADKIIKP